MKTCSKCGLEKDESEFYGNSRGGLASQCKTCRKHYKKTHKKERPEAAKRADQEYQRKYQRSKLLADNYGLSQIQYGAMLEKQNGCCAICGRHQSEFKKTLAVDHNHETGKNRGLLCGPCNTARGLLKEDREVLRKAILYLQIYNQ